MNFLEERIMKDGVVKPGNVLKVDSFLNHQMDIQLMEEVGREFKALRFTRYNQYESMILPMVKYLEGFGVQFSKANMVRQ